MDEASRRRRQEELAFFGKIGADISHEMRNVLAIVGENAGLLDDQLALARGRKVPDPDKLKNVAARIARQVAKGIEVMERFSRFAHAADRPLASVELVSLIDDVTHLVQRHVRHLGGSLATALPDGPVVITTDPFRLQHALFCCLQLVWQCAEKHAPVKVELAPPGTSAVLTVSGAAGTGAGELATRLAELSEVMNALEAGVTASAADGVLSLVVTLPLRPERTGEVAT